MKTSPNSGAWAGLFILVALYLALSAMYRRATPPLEASDEGAHMMMVMYVREHGRLPALGSGEAIRFMSQEMTQAPLYYALAACWVRDFDFADADNVFVHQAGSPIGRADLPGYRNMWNPRPDAANHKHGTLAAVHRARLLSMLMGLGLVLAGWQLARELAPSDPGAAFAAAAWVAFNPMFLFIANSVNNDNLVALLVSLSLIALVRMDRARLRMAAAVGVGGMIGLAVLAKSSGLILLPTALVAVLARRDAPWTKRLFAGAALTASVLVVSGWWFIRNHRLYSDWNASSLMASLAFNARPHADPWALIREWDGFVKSYWGVFGGFNVIYPDCVYSTFFALTAVALIAASVFLFRRRPPAGRGAWLLALASAFNVLAVAYWTSRLLGSQGRLLFPTLGAHAALWAISTQLFGRARNAVRVAVSVLLLGLAWAAGAWVIPADYPPASRVDAGRGRASGRSEVRACPPRHEYALRDTPAVYEGTVVGRRL